VLRVPTVDGDLYLKQEQPLQAYEVPLLAALSKRWPDRVPEVVAADVERSWLLMRDGGASIADSGRMDAFPLALRLYAELQVGEAAHVGELLSYGLRDMRLSVVTDAYEPFLERDHGLEPAEVARLRSLAPKFRALCEQLATFHLPASIQHDDLQQWNIFVRGERVAIYDWGDSSVGFPLWSWTKPIRDLSADGIDSRPLRDAYLEPWTAVAPLQELLDALELAIPTGQFAYAMQTRRQFDALPEARDDYAEYLPQQLRRALGLLEAA
jgi:hypothetical protein